MVSPVDAGKPPRLLQKSRREMTVGQTKAGSVEMEQEKHNILEIFRKQN